MTDAETTHFTVRGVFAGFFRDIFGKRRMVLREEKHEAYLKVPKAFRRELGAALRPGQEVIVTGREEGKRRIVTGVRPVDSAVQITSPILVCAKKNCWRSGGHVVWDALQQGIASEGGLARSVTLRQVDCLGHCKQGPNVEWSGRSFHRCSPEDARGILAAAVE